MTQICVPLIEEQTAGIIDRMVDLADRADLFEVRGDYVRDLDLLTIIRARTKPIIFTCRCASEGGRFKDDDPRRRMILLEAAKRGFDYVDVEYRSQYHDVMVEKAGNGLIVSYHDVEGTPDNLPALYDRMCAAGADLVKIVTSPRSIADVGRLLAFADRASREGGAPLLALAMGPLGALTRVLAGRYEAPFTFASAAAGSESAPGQLTLDDMAERYRVREIGRDTRVYGILGRSVGHSLSPIIHNRAFAERGIDARYVTLEAEALEAFVQSLPPLKLSGFSVTAPYKVDILPHLAEIDEMAALCGSVNTVVVRDDGTLQGSSTDGSGVLVPLKKRLDVKGKPVVIVGAGGAARAAAFALHRKKAQVTLLARDPAKAAVVATAVGCEYGDLSTIGNRTWDVLINATPIGGMATVKDTPVPASCLRRGTVVFDMVYVPQQTRLLREAQAAGCQIIGGLEMLLAQAVGQFETWTGTEAPGDVMLEAVMNFLAQSEDEQASAES
jgi:3-dehydroquinate dehydratase/shikimate dehydrogenase